MMNFFKAHRWLVISGGILILVVGGVVIYRRQNTKPPEMVTASVRSLTAAVTVTGRVTSSDNLDLSFSTSGRLSKLAASAGDHVKAGQVLAELDNAGLRAAVSQARAAVAVQNANLAALKSGTRPEQLAVTQTQVTNAEKALVDAQAALQNAKDKADVDLNNLYDGVSNILNGAYLNADDAVTKQLDQLFTGAQSGSPRLSYVTSASQAQLDAESGRQKMQTTLSEFHLKVQSLSGDHGALDASMISATQYLKSVRDLLDDVSVTLSASTNLSSTTQASYKGYVNTARTNINTSLTAIADVQQAIAAQRVTNANAITTATTAVSSASQSLAVAKDQLQLQKAGPTKDQLASAEAQVEEALANQQAAEVNLDHTIIRAPIDGVITKKNVEIGESVAVNGLVYNMIADTKLEIDANVPEVDIGKVAVGNPVDITLDAYPGQHFRGKVAYIDPAETIIEGVVNYKVKIGLEQDDDHLKSGLTANLDIETSHKDSVVALPQYAILENDQGTFVRKLKADGSTEDVRVELGLRGEDGYVEVKSGVADKEAVVNIGAKKN